MPELELANPTFGFSNYYFLEKNHLLSNCQYRFRSNKSTGVVFDFINEITEGLENGDHCLAAHKIAQNGFGSNSCFLLETFLKQRRQYSQIDGEKAEIFSMDFDVA